MIASGVVPVLADALGLVCVVRTVLRLADGAAAVGLLASGAFGVLAPRALLGG